MIALRRKDGGMTEPPDFTDRFNTQLSPDDESQFQTWAKANGRENDTYDYDLRGFWKAGGDFADNGHASDAYKKPNHPTFSTGSIYSRGGPYQAGQWSGGNGGEQYVFTPGATNIEMMGTDGLRRYFSGPAEAGKSQLYGQPMKANSRAAGGSTNSGIPLWHRPETFASPTPAIGFLGGYTPGRADALHTKTRGGSYVFPADVVSAAGEGNSMAGAKALQHMLGTGPYGTPLTPMSGHPTMPRGSAGLPRQVGMPGGTGARMPRLAAGGGAPDDLVDVALSDGELVATPEQMMQLGGGDLKRGHKIADALVKEIRRRHIAKLKSLPGPVGSSKK
jgi:hypothetical protein